MSAVTQHDPATRRKNRRLAFGIAAFALAVMVWGSWYLCYFGLPMDRILYH